MNSKNISRIGINYRYCLLACVFLIFMSACKDDTKEMPDIDDGDLTDITYDPQFESPPRPRGFGEMPIPEDNPLTTAGIELGRHLFYDPILSRDSTISCATCHHIEKSFTDGVAKSIGIDGRQVNRNSMNLIDIGYNINGLFWDGRVSTLEELVTHPIEDFREMDNDWEIIEADLQQSDRYPKMFREAFGIDNISEIKRPLVEKSLAQFMRIMVSSGESIFDRVTNGDNIIFTESETNGFQMFFIENAPGIPDAGCFHCHNEPLFTDNTFRNNGVQDEMGDLMYADQGRGLVTGNRFDNGKMRVPTLRNILLTAPYMHDGRFSTIEEVIDHYVDGIHLNTNTDPELLPGTHDINLSEQQKKDIIAFLSTLTDTVALKNPRLSNPFE